MAYTYDKTTDSIVINGFDKGIAPSPNLGIGDMKCANISTVPGELLVNFARQQKSEYFNTTGSLTMGAGSSLASYTYTVHTSPNTFLLAGNWIKILTSSIAELVVGTSYFIDFSGSPFVAQIGLSATYDDNQSTTITSAAGGSATWQFLPNGVNSGGQMAKPVAGATEPYTDASFVNQTRYYIMDTEGHVWCYDTGLSTNWGATGVSYWVLIDTQTARNAVYGGGTTEPATGLAVYNGYLIVFIGELACYKLTAMLGQNPRSPGSAGWASSSVFGVYGNNPSTTFNSQRGNPNPHFTYNSKSGALYWTDNSFVGSLFATANTGGNPNVFSYGKVTTSSSAGLLFTLTNVISGAIPAIGMPITFYTSSALPGNITADVIYYVVSVTLSGLNITFKVSTTKGGAAVAFASTGTGNLFYNTLDLNNNSTFIFSPQALTLPQENDISQCITEIGSQLLIGCASNTLYFWDGVAITPNGYLFLPEANTVNMITANNMAFVFCGNRGNIYITNGNTASVVTTVPDYITGMPDPYFIWGGAMYARGRIWFSIQDQTSTHTGNAGGVWSFVPTQNFFPGQDTGLALHLEHQNSYGTYNGVTNVLLPIINQQVQGIQYWSAWTSDAISGATYGIDGSMTTPYTGGQTIIETDLIPIGNYLEKGNFTSILTQYDAPLVSGETVQIKYRNAITGAWIALTDTLGGIDSVVGSFGTRFVPGWAQQTLVQLQIILTSTTTSPSYVRLKEIRIKK